MLENVPLYYYRNMAHWPKQIIGVTTTVQCNFSFTSLTGYFCKTSHTDTRTFLIWPKSCSVDQEQHCVTASVFVAFLIMLERYHRSKVVINSWQREVVYHQYIILKNCVSPSSQYTTNEWQIGLWFLNNKDLINFIFNLLTSGVQISLGFFELPMNVRF